MFRDGSLAAAQTVFRRGGPLWPPGMTVEGGLIDRCVGHRYAQSNLYGLAVEGMPPRIAE
ncbi:hypothetical protein FACS1894158_16060 [Betaproteobacteria bacterium]|nr:hypothetical protein FACS1894158_16060 [Betaproteobacteria bacterium]